MLRNLAGAATALLLSCSATGSAATEIDPVLVMDFKVRTVVDCAQVAQHSAQAAQRAGDAALQAAYQSEARRLQGVAVSMADTLKGKAWAGGVYPAGREFVAELMATPLEDVGDHTEACHDRSKLLASEAEIQGPAAEHFKRGLARRKAAEDQAEDARLKAEHEQWVRDTARVRTTPTFWDCRFVRLQGGGETEMQEIYFTGPDQLSVWRPATRDWSEVSDLVSQLAGGTIIVNVGEDRSFRIDGDGTFERQMMVYEDHGKCTKTTDPRRR